jgi:hypothetical protein
MPKQKQSTQYLSPVQCIGKVLNESDDGEHQFFSSYHMLNGSTDKYRICGALAHVRVKNKSMLAK